jgi:hypothetical protein
LAAQPRSVKYKRAGQKAVSCYQFLPQEGLALGRRCTFGVVACVQEVAVTSGELLADAELIHCTMGASEKDEEEAIRRAVDFSTTARRPTEDWSGLPCEARFRERKLGSAQPHYLLGSPDLGEPNI